MGLIDTAEGMQYLHTLNLVHRDLKAGNLLVSDTMVVCVTDFGVSKMMTQEMSKAAGTPMYMSPEIIEGKTYSFSADTYSFAFVVWELFARKLPYGDMIPWEITKQVCDDGLRPEPLDDPIDLLCNRCWDQDPNKRPTFAMILHYLKEIQQALRDKGESAFAAACIAKRSILDEFVANAIDSTPRINSKLKRISGFSDMDGASGSFAASLKVSPKHLLTASPSAETPTSPPAGSGGSSSSSQSKSILNMLPLTRGRKSFAERRSHEDAVNGGGNS